MGKPLRVLVVEDREEDAQLLLLYLRRGDFDVTFERVDTPEAMSDALAKQPWDIVISDYSMPRFSGLAALALLKQRKLDLPFIITSGTVGEDVAVEALHAGAHDFMTKGKLARLIPAIEREMREAALRAERAEMQEQLLISDRMALVGTLAAGVAHEINNPLAALMANLQLVIEDISKLDEEFRQGGEVEDPPKSNDVANERIAAGLREIGELLREAQECAERVRTIVRDVRIFSRGDEETTGAVDVHRVLDSSIRMAWNEIRHRAKLVKDYGDVPPVKGNEGRLGQVFLNLIVNAAQAMPEGSTDQNEIRVITSQDDQGWVVVEVRDTGPGIPESVISRIFDPFFSTKPIGEGTGLGLAICHGIVTGLGGQIVVESQVGKGTVVRTILAVAIEAALEAAPPAVVAVLGRSGRILVIDDEPMLGNILRRMLSTDHEVLAVTSAREGIELISHGERFDVILCDLMMPDVTGMDLHAELSELALEQAEKMVFMTGGAFTIRAREFLDRVRNPRVEKPFEMANLRAIVSEVIGKE